MSHRLAAAAHQLSSDNLTVVAMRSFSAGIYSNALFVRGSAQGFDPAQEIFFAGHPGHLITQLTILEEK